MTAWMYQGLTSSSGGANHLEHANRIAEKHSMTQNKLSNSSAQLQDLQLIELNGEVQQLRWKTAFLLPALKVHLLVKA